MVQHPRGQYIIVVTFKHTMVKIVNKFLSAYLVNCIIKLA